MKRGRERESENKNSTFIDTVENLRPIVQRVAVRRLVSRSFGSIVISCRFALIRVRLRFDFELEKFFGDTLRSFS